MLGLLIVAAGWLVYANALRTPFLFDDLGTVVQNPHISEGPLWGRAFGRSPNTALAGRPIVQLTFAINYAIGGLNTYGYHAVNLGFHLLSALLIFAIVSRTLEALPWQGFDAIRRADAACAVGLLWIVHPLNSEVVDYVTQRTESMMAVFFLLTLYASIRGQRASQPRRWQTLAVLSCFAGAACKETIAAAPIAIVLYDRAFVFDSLAAALRRRWRFYLALATSWLLIAALLWANGQSTSAGFETARTSARDYFLNQPRLLIRYLWLTVWPRPLVLYYGWPTHAALYEVWPYLALVTALFCGALWLLVSRPSWGFLAGWVFLTLAPSSSFVPVATEVGAERRMYLPLAAMLTALVIGIVALVNRVARGKTRLRMFTALVSAIVVALSVSTIARNREYSSPLVMARTILERWPVSTSHYLVGIELGSVGEHDSAIVELERAAPDYPPARFQLGSELLRAGRTADGAVELERFINDEPTSVAARLAHGLLANTLADEQRFGEAIPHYRAYLEANANDANAWNALGVAQMRTDRVHDAVESFGRAARARPHDARLWMNLGNASLENGRVDDARRAFTNALDADPSFAPAAAAIRRLNLGR